MNDPQAAAPVLALTDFSDDAHLAAERAARMAAAAGCALVLLHAPGAEWLAALRRWLGEQSPPEGALLDAAGRELRQAAEALAQRHGIAVEPRLVDAGDGSTAAALAAEAVALRARCVVLGARGAGRWRRMLIGTTAERLLRACPLPLLVVRNPAPGPYRRVLVGVDHSPWSRPALDAARAIAPGAEWVLAAVYELPFGEKLRFAGVDEATIAHYRAQARLEAQRAVDALAAAAALPAGRWRAAVGEGEAALELVAQATALGCELVAVGKHGRSATEDLLLGSVTQHVLAESAADVLVSTARDTAAGP